MSTDAATTHDLRSYLEAASGALRTGGISITPYTDRSLGHCAAVPGGAGKVIETLSAMQALLGNAPESSQDGIDFELNLLKRFCSQLNLRVPKEFSKLIAMGDIIEIYNGRENVQVFRNFNFLRHCTYDLLTLLTHPFTDLFQRDDEITSLILARADHVWREEHGPVAWNVPEHVVVERMNPELYKFKMSPKFVAPVFEMNGRRFGWVSSLTVKPLGSWTDEFPNVRPLKR